MFHAEIALETVKLAILERLEFEKSFTGQPLRETDEDIFICKIFRLLTKTKMTSMM